MAKHVLITGFEPFGGEKVNPSELVARSLEGRLIAGRPLAVRVLSVESHKLRERLMHAAGEESPDIIIGLGQAACRTALAIERVAVNVLDFRLPDNAGILRRNESIVRGGPDARLSPLPFAEIVSAWAEHDIPGYVSNSAGTHLCNQFLYEALGLAERVNPPIAAGFVHLPYLPSQAVSLGPESTPSMALELMTRGIEILIETVVPWVEQRLPDRVAAQAAAKGAQPELWIPRV